MIHNTHKKIWVVDDDDGILDVMQILLKEEGYEIKAINSPAHLEEELVRDKPNLLLLDILMSGMDGRTIARNLKSNKYMNDIPIILMSADMHIEEKAKEGHADNFIKKPFEVDELLGKIKKYI